MTTYKIAHIYEQGQDLIIIPLNDQFEHTTEKEKAGLETHLQRCATSAGLKGLVVLVWPDGARMKFIAPPAWHPFVGSLTLHAIHAMINRELHCD
jgi:hypothetical protein